MNEQAVERFINTTHEIKKLMDIKCGICNDPKSLTRLQFQALKHIELHPDITIGELSGALIMSSGSMAQLIERLEEGKWIYKIVDNRDKRIFHISLTQTGIEEILRMKKVFMKKMSSMLSLISEEDLNETIRIQERLLTKLKETEKIC